MDERSKLLPETWHSNSSPQLGRGKDGDASPILQSQTWGTGEVDREKVFDKEEIELGRISPCRRNAALGLIATLSSTFFLLWVFRIPLPLSSTSSTSTPSSVDAAAESQAISQSLGIGIERSWGALSPYFAVEPYKEPPSGCKITQVNLLQRHGARYPPPRASQRIKTVIAKLQSAGHYRDHRLDFFRNYTSGLGITELMAFGGVEAQRTGQTAYERYKSIMSPDKPPFLRSSSARRVVESAGNWSMGFSLASQQVYNPKISVIIHESKRSNNTLDHKRCPNLGSAAEYVTAWTNVFAPPIANRLNRLAPGANITAVDISNLMAACALDTMHSFALSPICNLFTPKDFADYEYLADVEKYYNTGYGQPLGPVQGVGYINELVARLSGSPVQDNTQTNHTLDSSPVTFPLHQTFYADFSHGNQMIAIYAALGLFKQDKPLDPATRRLAGTKSKSKFKSRRWVASWITSFSTGMVVERLECNRRLEHSRTHKRREGTFVRILVNDALQPLEFCGADVDGLCELGRFVESQGYARRNGDGDFERCIE